MSDFQSAVSVMKDTSSESPGKPVESSISLIWIVTGVPNLTKVGVVVVWSSLHSGHVTILFIALLILLSRWVWPWKVGVFCASYDDHVIS